MDEIETLNKYSNEWLRIRGLKNGSDNTNKAFFRPRKTKFFWKSGDFAGDRKTGDFFLGNMRYFWDVAKKKSGKSSTFSGGVKVLLKQRC